MYEELVKRLKISKQLADDGLLYIPSILCLEAANAIEELDYKNRKLLSDLVKHTESTEEN